MDRQKRVWGYLAVMDVSGVVLDPRSVIVSANRKCCLCGRWSPIGKNSGSAKKQQPVFRRDRKPICRFSMMRFAPSPCLISFLFRLPQALTDVLEPPDVTSEAPQLDTKAMDSVDSTSSPELRKVDPDVMC